MKKRISKLLLAGILFAGITFGAIANAEASGDPPFPNNSPIMTEETIVFSGDPPFPN